MPADKRIEAALTYIFGIGSSSARKILKATGVNPDIRVKNLSEGDTARLRTEIETRYKIEGALRTETGMSIKRLMDIGAYRGLRHRRRLPVRGQRTKTNARTRKGPKKTAGAIKRKAMAKRGPSRSAKEA